MARVTAEVPTTAEQRLDELATILARGVLRADAKKNGSSAGEPLELSAETRLSVSPRPWERARNEVT